MNERMDRRRFVAVAGGAALTVSAGNANGQADEPLKSESPYSNSTPETAVVLESTWLPLVWWHVDHQDNVDLQQGRPVWVPEATYEYPTFD